MSSVWSIPALLGFAVFLLGIIVLGGTSAADENQKRPVTTVRSVDLERYAGLWYEIAKIPNRFQRQCSHGTTAQYTIRKDGRITVLNRCFKRDGGVAEAEGVAKIVSTTTNARLKVSFVSFAGFRPFWGDYWVIGLDPEYRWAVVGTPNRKYGWVLARTPKLDEDTMEEVFQILERNGYQRDSFVMSPQ